MKKILLLFFLSFLWVLSIAQNPYNVRDITDPISTINDALCGPLHTVTICTANLDSIEQFYVKGMGMSLLGPFNLSKKEIRQQKELWDLPAMMDYSLYLLHRPTVSENIRIRVLVVNKRQPLIHRTYNTREMGPFSLGFPNANQEKLDSIIKELGFADMSPMETAVLNKPDGSKYRYLETIYKAPDFVHVVGIERGNGMPQLAPYDSETLKGGPGFAAQIVTGMSKPILKFYTEVLGMEIRKNTEWKTSEKSSLGIGSNITYRLAIVYAKGATSGHLLFIDFKDNIRYNMHAAPRPPNRGIGMYSFETKNIKQVYNNAKEMDIKIIQKPTDYKDPIIGNCRIMTMVAPNGFLIEVFQTK